MWANPQKTADLVTLTEEILIENFIFCIVTDIFAHGLWNILLIQDSFKHLRWNFLQK